MEFLRGLLRLAVIGVALALVIWGLRFCEFGSQNQSPKDTSGPVFTMAIEPTPCPEGTEATACFTAVITNYGDPGDGTCALLGPDENVPPTPVWQLRVKDVPRYSTVRALAIWTAPAQERYVPYCDPAPRA